MVVEAHTSDPIADPFAMGGLTTRQSRSEDRVVDIKTSYAIYRDYGIQTSAYVEALKEDQSMPSLKRWILRLDQARFCIRGCGAKMREKGGNIKIREAKLGRAKKCSHVWGELIGEVELRELPEIEVLPVAV